MEQLANKVQFLLKHLRLEDSIGLIVSIVLCWAQVCGGTSTYILQDMRPIPHLEGKWVNLCEIRLALH
eukprot:2978222-Ditylum_brightwellii.AAC.1